MTQHTDKQSGFAIIEAILIVVILAIVGGTGYYIYHANSKTVDTYDAASDSSSSIVTGNKKAAKTDSTSEILTGPAANSLVKTTYEKYIAAIASDSNRSSDAALLLIKSSLTSDLYAKLTATSGYDPLTCAQELVPSFTTVPGTTSGAKANITVIEAFNDPLKIAVTVDLMTQKITSVTCPSL